MPVVWIGAGGRGDLLAASMIRLLRLEFNSNIRLQKVESNSKLA
jgi:hypothetical protein